MENTMNKPLKSANNKLVSLENIPDFAYEDFYRTACHYLKDEACHCVTYFAFVRQSFLIFICALADDSDGSVYLLSHKRNPADENPLISLTEKIPSMSFFEREISEKYGIEFTNHPWLKPFRYPHDRFDKNSKIEDYPFYNIESEELHEVGVGPIHAGIIEPGHFRFICNGEMVLHLEIQLGWQHRGLESALLDRKKLLERTVLSEQIAGDTAIGHSVVFAQAMETLGQLPVSSNLQRERVIALELERIAVHTGDMSALCTDVAYQLGSAVFGILRTPIVNFMQDWCGNRLGKSLIRTGGTWRPLTPELQKKLLSILEEYEFRFLEVARDTRTMASIENRFENIGTISTKQTRLTGAVGMTARMSGISRDIRKTHPFGGYSTFGYTPVVFENGDVLSRFILRKLEIMKSLDLIRKILKDTAVTDNDERTDKPVETVQCKADSLVISLAEGWRGEICHTAVTDNEGELLAYHIKDPSNHNWQSLELSLRNLEISDFPINNKSFNLSYCGHDL